MNEPLERPLISFVLIAYNQEMFIREAVEGALAQTYSPLEIILSDDCSSDRTFEVMREMAESYQGRHSVRIRRCGTNMGICRHLSLAVAEAHGLLYILSAGDDISAPQRTTVLYQAFLNSGGRARSIHSNFDAMDSYGKVLPGGFEPKCAPSLNNFLNLKFLSYGATQSVHREVFDFFGSLNCGVDEDNVLLHRALLLGEGVYVPERLVRVRMHSSSVSGGLRDNFSEGKQLAYLSRRHLDGVIAWGSMIHDCCIYMQKKGADGLKPENLTLLLRNMSQSILMHFMATVPVKKAIIYIFPAIIKGVSLNKIAILIRKNFKAKRLRGT